MKKIKPYTRYWEKLANEEARLAVEMHPCATCGYPVIRGYQCMRCESPNPIITSNQRSSKAKQ